MGKSDYNTAIYGETGNNNIAVYGLNKDFGPGVHGSSNHGFEVSGTSNDTAAGIYGTNTVGEPAAQFDGPVTINGNLSVGSPGQGIILKSPDGSTCKLLTIDNTGAMVLSTLTCSWRERRVFPFSFQ